MNQLKALLVGLFLTSVSQAILVDDFDSYDISSSTKINDLGTPWVTISNADLVNVINDGTGNQVLAYGGSGAYNPNITPIANTDTATTLFARFYVNSEDCDNSFGLRDTDAAAWFADFEVQLAIIRSGTLTDGKVDFKARNGGSTTFLTSIDINKWYNVWLVINQSTDKYDVYLNTGTAPATSADRLATGYSFRNGTLDPLNAILALSYSAASGGVYFDDINLTPGADLSRPVVKPYEPTVNMTADGSDVDITLNWKAGLDPLGVNAVNPNITNQYVFYGSDPNMYYRGNTGDPGVSNPDSQYSFTGEFDKTYKWAVVSGLPGMKQSFTAGTTTFAEVTDPNCIIGSVWRFETLRSSAVISTQPSDVRAFVTDASASFTVGYSTQVNPVVAADWYKDGVKLVPGGDINVTFTSAVGEGESTLTIATPGIADQGKYYCILSTESDAATTSDDAQSATRLLTIKQMLSRYTFDNAADLLADTGELAAEVGVSRPAATVKSVSLDTPDETTATVVVPGTVTGINGNALFLGGNEYMDLGALGYPCAGPLDTLGDIRGGGYEKQGFGRGMDEGSILCWVRLNSDGAIIGNANIADGTHFAITTNGTDNGRIIVRGENWDTGWQNLGEANGNYSYMQDFSLQNGQWDMFAATWDNSTARIYINGELVATNTQGYAEVYKPWDLANVVGVSRQAQPNRHLFNAADFLTGAVDELRIYNYAVPGSEIAAEYASMNTLGVTPCLNHSFVGNAANLNNTAASYCVVDIYDFAVIASNWLSNGFDVE
ncbi:MAG: hypothetical protein JXM68_12230 [Sedimentisphaerales bacterium]|nr:hypothetical protein [Sedimentisphaerales bacterium]